jgi:hypothetical protein
VKQFFNQLSPRKGEAMSATKQIMKDFLIWLSGAYPFNPKQAKIFQDILNLIETQPEVDEEFIERWGIFFNDNFYDPKSSEHTKEHVREMLEEIPVRIKEAK